MRDLNYHDGDSVRGPLGDAIKREKKEPDPVEVSPGVFRGADGKLHTNAPLPTEAAKSSAASDVNLCACGYTMLACAMQSCDREVP